jgi:ribosomal protein S1
VGGRINELDDQLWEDAKRRFPVGHRVRGVVTRHFPFGVFVDLDDPAATGLIQIVDFRDQGRMTPDQYPPVGATVEGVVLGHRGSNKQVILSTKPSLLVGSP